MRTDAELSKELDRYLRNPDQSILDNLSEEEKQHIIDKLNPKPVISYRAGELKQILSKVDDDIPVVLWDNTRGGFYQTDFGAQMSLVDRGVIEGYTGDDDDDYVEVPAFVISPMA